MPHLAEKPVHLGLGAKASVQPPFDGPAWYEDYASRQAADGAEGRLVSQWDFTQSWDSWEMHPAGDEVVICVSGEITLVQQDDEGIGRSFTLGPGEYAINPAGVWHTADIAPKQEARCIFITAGLGTQHLPR